MYFPSLKKSYSNILVVTREMKMIRLQTGLMKDHGQQARASENFAGAG